MTSKETSSPSFKVLNPCARDGRVMHEYVLPGILGDEAKPFFIVEPFDFATSHN